LGESQLCPQHTPALLTPAPCSANGQGITSTGTTGTATDDSGTKIDPFTTFGSSGGAADLLVPRLALVGASVAAALAVFA
jgi:hypothetical protein